MGMEGDAADLLGRVCIQIAEATMKLGGAGLKNIALFFFALGKEHQKLVGKTKLTEFIKGCDGPAESMPLRTSDIGKFSRMAKGYGILWAPVKLKRRGDGTRDILIRPRDKANINRVLEQLGYPCLPSGQEAETPKKPEARAPQEQRCERRGSGLTNTEELTTSTNEERPSARGRLAYFASKSKEQSQTPVGPEIPIGRQRPELPRRGPEIPYGR